MAFNPRGVIASIRSGGQSGVDRAALDCALELGLPCEGWCPAGGLAEDFLDPPGLLAVYPFLLETPSADPAQRTEWNVRDSDATLVLACDDGIVRSPGTLFTIEVAQQLGRPCFAVSVFDGPDPQVLEDFLAFAQGRRIVLNVAGPRESGCPGIYVRAKGFLTSVLGSGS
jgi:hypothetical protein